MSTPDFIADTEKEICFVLADGPVSYACDHDNDGNVYLLGYMSSCCGQDVLVNGQPSECLYEEEIEVRCSRCDTVADHSNLRRFLINR